MTVKNMMIRLWEIGKRSFRGRAAAPLLIVAITAVILWRWQGDFGLTAYGAVGEEQSNENQEQRLFDEAGLIPEDEAESIKEGIGRVRTKTGMDVVVVTATMTECGPLRNMPMISTTRGALEQGKTTAAFCIFFTWMLPGSGEVNAGYQLQVK